MPVETYQNELKSISHYDLIEKIAEGGMGSVYRGQDRRTGKTVAVKIVPPHLLSNKVFLKRFEQEYLAGKALDHPNVVRALDFGREGETLFLVMEFVHGETLGTRLDRVTRLPENEAIRIIVQVAQGLHKAHKMGLVHRDVKPDNIMITAEGVARLTDLGLVKEVDCDLNLTRTGRGLGTPHFMAPEQFRNAKNADARCDIYSLAATLYMMVTGELPFRSCSPLDAWMKKIHNELPGPREVLPSLSERVDWAIRKSMKSDPNQRASSCREFIEDLTGQSVRKAELAPTLSEKKAGEIWYLVYRDEQGIVHTVKGSKDGIRRSLQEELLGDATNVRASRTKAGPFEPLHQFAEFRDLVTPPPALVQAAPAVDSLEATQAISKEKVNVAASSKDRVNVNSKDKVNVTGPRNTPRSVRPTGKSQDHLQPTPDALAGRPVEIRIPVAPRRDGSDWTKILIFLITGLGLGVSAFFLLPKLLGTRLF